MRIDCPHCAFLQDTPATAEARVWRCLRCRAVLGRVHRSSIDLPLAMALACIPMFFIANGFPLVSLSIQGETVSTTLPGAIVALQEHGMVALAILVFATTLLAPAIQILSTVSSLLVMKLGVRSRHTALLSRVASACHDWNMVDVLMLGMLVALGKLAAIADVIPGPALWAYGCLLGLVTVLNSSFSAHDLWGKLGEPASTARKPHSLSRTAAYLLAAAALYVPANVLPIMHTSSIQGGEDDTIMSGVLVLLHGGSWPLAALVFFASVMVPLLKLIALAVLVLAARFGWARHPHELSRLYRLVEFVGRWSLLDIYALTLLVALVQLQALATIEPRGGAVAFATVVVLTILAARSFDPRLLWDRDGRGEQTQ
jgi:paraquat-inducible protein A